LPAYLETGEALSGAEARELRLAAAELTLRFGPEAAAAEVCADLAADAEAERRVRARAELALGLLAAQRGLDAEAVEQLDRAGRERALGEERRGELEEALGRAYLTLRRPGPALMLVEWALERAAEDPLLALRFALLLAELEPALEQSERAAALRERALAAFAEQPPTRTLASIYRQRAEQAWERGEAGAALGELAAARALLELENLLRSLARARSGRRSGRAAPVCSPTRATSSASTSTTPAAARMSRRTGSTIGRRAGRRRSRTKRQESF
jgi:hypothetical protein